MHIDDCCGSSFSLVPLLFGDQVACAGYQNYHANERETLAVIHALRVWKIYLFKPFELVTDNRAVTYLLSKKQLSGREARWLDLLAEFDMTISHKPGRENIADPNYG